MDYLWYRQASMVFWHKLRKQNKFLLNQSFRNFGFTTSDEARKKFKRFYDKVTVSKCPEKIVKEHKEYTQSKSHVNWRISYSDAYYRIHLDKYICKSFTQTALRIPSYPLAII